MRSVAEEALLRRCLGLPHWGGPQPADGLRDPWAADHVELEQAEERHRRGAQQHVPSRA